MRTVEVNEYKVVEDIENGTFKALRNGEEWKDLIGDNLTLSLIDRIDDLEGKLFSILGCINGYYMNEDDIPASNVLDAIGDNIASLVYKKH